MRDLEMLLSDIDESLERMNGELKTGVREVRGCAVTSGTLTGQDQD